MAEERVDDDNPTETEYVRPKLVIKRYELSFAAPEGFFRIQSGDACCGDCYWLDLSHAKASGRAAEVTGQFSPKARARTWEATMLKRFDHTVKIQVGKRIVLVVYHPDKNHRVISRPPWKADCQDAKCKVRLITDRKVPIFRSIEKPVKNKKVEYRDLLSVPVCTGAYDDKLGGSVNNVSYFKIEAPVSFKIDKIRSILFVVCSDECLINLSEYYPFVGSFMQVAKALNVLLEAGHAITFCSANSGRCSLLTGRIRPTSHSILSSLDELTEMQQLLYGKEASKGAFHCRTIGVGEVDTDLYDAVVIAGGHGMLYDFANCKEHSRILAQKISQIYARGNSVVGTVSHGICPLMHDECRVSGIHLLRGKTVTAFSNFENELVKQQSLRSRLLPPDPFDLEYEVTRKGAIFRVGEKPWKRHVVVTDRLVTGQNPDSAAVVAGIVLKILSGEFTGSEAME